MKNDAKIYCAGGAVRDQLPGLPVQEHDWVVVGSTPKEILPRHIWHELRSVELGKKRAQRVRMPGECRDLALLAARYHGDIHRAFEMRAEAIVKLLQSADAWRRPERSTQLLQACASDARGRMGSEQGAYPQADYLLHLLAAARAVDAGEIARQTVRPSPPPCNRRASAR